MKSPRYFIVGITLIGGALCVFPGSAAADLSGGPHDLRGRADSFPRNFVCEPCHAPNNTTMADSAVSPIWVSDPSAGPFTSYSSNTSGGEGTAVVGRDLVCLSCHDGSVAPEVQGGSSATSLAANMNAEQGNTDNHPVGFSYTAAQSAGSGLATRAAAESANFQFYGPDGDMTCGTCHDPHGTDSTSFLRASLGTGFCGKCHTDK